ncbi:MAG: membrane dipeptidase [Chloroflexota bacterium]
MIVDAHLDLAYNALEHKRDLFVSLDALRESEQKRPCREGIATVTFPELRKGKVGLVFATLFAIPIKAAEPLDQLVYKDADGAYALALQQLDYYKRIVDENRSLRLVTDKDSLTEVIEGQEGARPLIGLVPLMEGADSVRDPAELEEWWERGLRLIGPAWDDTRYAAGAWRGAQDGFSKDGYALLEIMADIGYILDLTHLSEQAVFEALERYEGHMVATHANSRVLAPHVAQRNLNDQQIRLLAERGGVIGVVLYNRFIKKGYAKGDRKETVTVADVVAHIDHICQLTGSADHVGIGSDFDGGFGYKDIPAEMNSVADLGKIGEGLKERGYESAYIDQILGENWINLLRKAWE